MGCGVGNETAFLLNEGWSVWAVDGDSAAKDWITSRDDIPEKSSLVIINSKFEEIDWDSLPKSQLIIAVNSLPFCEPDFFPTVWIHIKDKLAGGGRFVGYFFGDRYTGFTDVERRSMNFFTKQDLLALIDDFDIESFYEREGDGSSATGKNVHSHIFEVILRKR